MPGIIKAVDFFKKGYCIILKHITELLKILCVVAKVHFIVLA